jgi:hypothetical protein
MGNRWGPGAEILSKPGLEAAVEIALSQTLFNEEAGSKPGIGGYPIKEPRLGSEIPSVGEVRRLE